MAGDGLEAEEGLSVGSALNKIGGVRHLVPLPHHRDDFQSFLLSSRTIAA